MTTNTRVCVCRERRWGSETEREREKQRERVRDRVREKEREKEREREISPTYNRFGPFHHGSSKTESSHSNPKQTMKKYTRQPPT